MRISDWSSDVCSSDLFEDEGACQGVLLVRGKVDGDGAVPVPVQAVARGRVLDVVAGQIAMPPADTGDIVHAPLPVFVQYEGCRVQVGVDRAALYYRGAGRTLEAAAAVGADGEAAKEVHAHGRTGIPADIVEVDLEIGRAH